VKRERKKERKREIEKGRKKEEVGNVDSRQIVHTIQSTPRPLLLAVFCIPTGV
jgi:hypothetical protein